MNQELKKAKSIGDEDARSKIKELIGEEKAFKNSNKRKNEERVMVDKLKTINK